MRRDDREEERSRSGSEVAVERVLGMSMMIKSWEMKSQRSANDIRRKEAVKSKKTIMSRYQDDI